MVCRIVGTALYLWNYTPAAFIYIGYIFGGKMKDPVYYKNPKDTPHWELNQYRFEFIINKLRKEFPQTIRSIDFGSYPGLLQMQLYETYGIVSDMAGLGLSNKMKKYFKDSHFYEFDFEKPTRKFEDERYAIATCFNVIEHLENPTVLLDTINKSLGIGGKLYLTTDNVSAGTRVLTMLKGGSPNEHLTKSKIFFNGDWKPHIRFYSKDDLIFMLQYCGFEIVRHEYFNHRGGQYDANGKRQWQGLRRWFVENTIERIFPHLRDHHFIEVRKVMSHEACVKKRPKPTKSDKEWIKLRSNWQSYEVFNGARK